MIHLSTLTTALLRLEPAADESVASPLEPTADRDAALANGHSYEPMPSLPSQDDIKRALHALRDRQIGSAKHESAAASMPASSGSGGASPFAILARLFAARALNPQPLPPGDPKRALVSAALTDPLAARALNPQPLPPGDPKRALVSTALNDPLAARALNPQPLPPGDPKRALVAALTDSLAARALNPQPLPPRASPSMINDPLAAAGLNPQPLPPKGDSVQDITKPFFRAGYQLPPYAE